MQSPNPYQPPSPTETCDHRSSLLNFGLACLWMIFAVICIGISVSLVRYPETEGFAALALSGGLASAFLGSMLLFGVRASNG